MEFLTNNNNGALIPAIAIAIDLISRFNLPKLFVVALAATSNFLVDAVAFFKATSAPVWSINFNLIIASAIVPEIMILFL